MRRSISDERAGTVDNDGERPRSLELLRLGRDDALQESLAGSLGRRKTLRPVAAGRVLGHGSSGAGARPGLENDAWR